jgi:hypothetical protein
MKGGTSVVTQSGVELIPGGALFAVGAVFAEGHIKYPPSGDRPNWHYGAWNIAWVRDRVMHAARHRLMWQMPYLRELLKTPGEDDIHTADHLAKAMWFDTLLADARVNPDFAGSPLAYFANHASFVGYVATTEVPAWVTQKDDE